MTHRRPEHGAEQQKQTDHTNSPERPESFNKLYGPEEAARTSDKPVSISRADHISSLDSAHGAFHNASAQAKADFLACYADADPITKATLALMTREKEKPPSTVLA